MKKKILLMPLAVSLLLVGCGGNQSQNNNNNNEENNNEETKKDYNIVEFNLNYGDEKNVYQNLVVKEGEKLTSPSKPYRQDYVFDGWYLEKECTEEFAKFGETVDSDFTLYAKWTEYESLTNVEKIDFFLDTIKALEGNVKQTSVDTSEEILFFMPVEFNAQMVYETEYTRYKDIVVSEEYNYNDAGTELEKTGETQYFQDEENYYQIYDCIADDSLDSLSSARLSEMDSESFYNIGFTNLNVTSLIDLRYYLESSPETVLADGFDLSGIDVTGLSKTTSVIEYSYSYQTSFTGQADMTLQELHQVSGKISLVNGLINRNTSEVYEAIGMDGAYVMIDYKHNSYKYNQGEFEDFTGTRFNPADYAQVAG